MAVKGYSSGLIKVGSLNYISFRVDMGTVRTWYISSPLLFIRSVYDKER